MLEITEFNKDNFSTTQKAINSRKRSHCHLLLRRMSERLEFLLKISGNRRSKIGTTKDTILRGNHTTEEHTVNIG